MANLHLTPSPDFTFSASASTSHGNTNDYVYHVFINHRGPDVKKGLASHLYRRLSSNGLRAFLDTEELQRGDTLTPQIEGAIRTSSVQVAIFSPTYAESSWCLNELVQMLESGSTIIPVFYGVHPSELRWTGDRDGIYATALTILQCIFLCTRGENGGYARALSKLEKKTTFDSRTRKWMPRHDSNTIQKWRKALSDVSQISGFELGACNGDEGELVDKVAEQVLIKVSKTPLNVAKYPTGLDEKVKDLEAIVLSQNQSGKARAVGIVGFAGVGKTTLIKEFFNRHRSNYSRSCFLSDIRENAAPRSLHSLQSNLLKDLIHADVQINSTDEGTEKLKRLPSSSHRALIVLDDVDHMDQLDALFSPVRDTIHTESLIVVTSRNKDLLISSGIVESFIYKQTGLNRQHSQELFCSHAFNQPYPVTGFEKVVAKLLEVCHGLPLSLKVIGALLCGKDLEYWEAQFNKISKILPSDILRSLQISYDNLDPEEKQIFLDIACFFIGEHRETVIRIWNGSGWEGLLGLRNLENRCLVEVDGENRIRMHDHLRDLGRHMADKEPSEYPRRIWRLNHFGNMSDQSTVRGITMAHGDGPEQSFQNLLSSRLLNNMSRLQLLRAEGSFVETLFSFGELPQLIWLCWKNCPCASLPSSIRLENLRVLYIQGGNLETLWQHESQAPLQLRELNIDAPLLKIPKSIGKLKYLESLVLHKNYVETFPEEFCHMHSLRHMLLKCCKNMTRLPDSVGDFRNLLMLHLCGCSALRMLPDSVGHLTNLQSFHLDGCSALQTLPDSVGNLKNLQSLHMDGCSALQRLPGSVGNLRNLQTFHLGGCSALQMLPDTVGNLTNLQGLHLDGCSALHMLPDSVGNFTNLQSLHMDGCSALQRLPGSVGNLRNIQTFHLGGCSALQMLPDSIRNLINLQSLYLDGCSALHMLPNSVGNLKNLQSFYLGGCSTLQMLPDSIGNFTNLRSLDLGGCSALQGLPGSIGNLTNLQSLDLDRCSALQLLADSVGNLTNLQSLHLGGCSALQMLPDSVGNFVDLRSLDLGGCSNLLILPDSIGNFTNLRTLHLGGCSALQMLPESIGNFTNLRSLHLAGCRALQMLPDSVGNFTNLRSLALAGCCALQVLPDSVGNFTNVRSLHLGGCSALQMLPGSVGNFTNLQTLDLGGCSALQMLPGSIGSFSNLQTLNLGGCSALQMLPGSFGKLTNLQTLNLGRCSALQTLPDSVGNFRNLQRLYLSGCSALQRLPDSIGSFTNLQSLQLSKCSTLQMLPDSFGNLTNLLTLHLGGLTALQMLPGSVGNFKNLRGLHLGGCSALQMLPDSVGNFTDLRTLDLSGCSALQMLTDSVGNFKNLQTLLLRGCSALQMFPESVCNFTKLRSLDLGQCSALQMLPNSIGNLTNLESIILPACSTLQMLPDSIGNMTKLPSLNLSECSTLQVLPDSVGNLTNIQSLDLSGCSTLQILPSSIMNLRNLQSIHLRRCCNLKRLPSVEQLSSLEKLDVNECPKLQWGEGVVEQLRQRLKKGFVE